VRWSSASSSLPMGARLGPSWGPGGCMIDGLLFASCLHCALKKSLAVRFCLRLMGLPPCPSWANSVLRHMTTGTAFPRPTAHSLHQSKFKLRPSKLQTQHHPSNPEATAAPRSAYHDSLTPCLNLAAPSLPASPGSVALREDGRSLAPLNPILPAASATRGTQGLDPIRPHPQPCRRSRHPTSRIPALSLP
jgi:hypothetical protein